MFSKPDDVDGIQEFSLGTDEFISPFDKKCGEEASIMFSINLFLCH
jgi:hypothetical protein